MARNFVMFDADLFGDDLFGPDLFEELATEDADAAVTVLTPGASGRSGTSRGGTYSIAEFMQTYGKRRLPGTVDAGPVTPDAVTRRRRREAEVLAACSV